MQQLDHGIMYFISNSEWVSVIKIVPKETGVIVIDDKNKLIPIWV